VEEVLQVIADTLTPAMLTNTGRQRGCGFGSKANLTKGTTTLTQSGKKTQQLDFQIS